MSRDRFVTLIRDFCKRCNIDDAVGIADGGVVEVSGVPISIVHSEKIDPRSILLTCDMGECPRHNEGEFYAKFLQKNFYFSSTRGPAFTIDPTSGRVLLVQSLDLNELTTEQLQERLSNLATEAVTWRYLPRDLPRLSPPDELPRSGPLAAAPAHGHSLYRLARR